MPKRYCKDDAPPGWPILVDWSTFKGPSQNCSLALCTEIICEMLEAQGLNPLQHGPCQAAEEAAAAESEGESEGDEVEDVPVKKVRRENNIGVIRTSIVEQITQRQNLEENIFPAFERRRKNIVELEQGLKALEDGEIEEGEL